MRIKKFKCILLSDIIINQKAATEGNQETLDFIPGSNFLGIAASTLYQDEELSDEQKMLIFHSGKVRFGDAHPVCENRCSLRVPAAWFSPKIKTENNAGLLLVHYHIKDSDEYKKEQLKQYRTGFYCFNENKRTARLVDVNKSFVLKSAYDKDYRRSKDEQMFGYQALNKGLVLVFEISVDEHMTPQILEKIERSLLGKQRVGRSRTAQYGLVKIEIVEKGWQEKAETVRLEKDTVCIYANSRLIFLDEYGNMTYTPKPSDFYMKGTIVWAKSQIRTFQYAPWNSKRQTRDADRCGIEKGSVIIMKDVSLEEDFKEYVGVYQNEGFGKILIDPDFLRAQDTGVALYRILEKEIDEKEIPEQMSMQTIKEIIKLREEKKDILSYYLWRCKEQELVTFIVYKLVAKFVKDNSGLWEGRTFASQWGALRDLAKQHSGWKEIICEISNYLSYGVAKKKWAEEGRKGVLLNFLNGLKETITENVELTDEHEKIEAYLESLPEKMIRPLVINLAAEMSKKVGRTNE